MAKTFQKKQLKMDSQFFHKRMFSPSLKKVSMTQFHSKRQAFPKRINANLIPTDYLHLIFLISPRACDNFIRGCPASRFRSVHGLSQVCGTLGHCSLQNLRHPV